MNTRKLNRLFFKKKSFIEKRLKNDFVDNGIASIPCKVSQYEDIISSYSVRGYETLNPEFESYVKDTVDVIPAKYPIVLNIIGGNFSSEQEETIRDTIVEDFAYDLGMKENELKHHIGIFFFMMFGIVISALFLYMFDWLPDFPKELFFVIFWYMADTVVDYLFIGGHDLRKERILAGRLACIKVVFSDVYNEEDYTQSEVGEIFREIEEDVIEERR
ncbi:MAG: hypothetical protein Q4F31_08125 [Eubacteriales bacterium]|nr:hypothetical protein [Eubacteriales bacterium]